MKKFILIFALLVVCSNCGEDGKEGASYFSVWGDDYIRYYGDDNTSTPDTIYVNKNYRTSPGTYSFYYESYYGSEWYHFEGTYTIEVNEGKPGKIFSDGDDGKDNYYRLTLTTNSGYSFGLMKSNANNEDDFRKNNLEYLSYEKVSVGDILEENQITSQGRILIKKQM